MMLLLLPYASANKIQALTCVGSKQSYDFLRWYGDFFYLAGTKRIHKILKSRKPRNLLACFGDSHLIYPLLVLKGIKYHSTVRTQATFSLIKMISNFIYTLLVIKGIKYHSSKGTKVTKVLNSKTTLFLLPYANIETLIHQRK